MTIDEIMTMWENDSHIDDTDLDNESLKIPNLHQKYEIMTMWKHLQ